MALKRFAKHNNRMTTCFNKTDRRKGRAEEKIIHIYKDAVKKETDKTCFEMYGRKQKKSNLLSIQITTSVTKVAA